MIQSQRIEKRGKRNRFETKKPIYKIAHMKKNKKSGHIFIMVKQSFCPLECRCFRPRHKIYLRKSKTNNISKITFHLSIVLLSHVVMETTSIHFSDYSVYVFWARLNTVETVLHCGCCCHSCFDHIPSPFTLFLHKYVTDAMSVNI